MMSQSTWDNPITVPMMAPAAGGMCCTVMNAGTTHVAVPESAKVQAAMPRPPTAIHFDLKISVTGICARTGSFSQVKPAIADSRRGPP